jgi:hypothetical protein
MKKILFLVFFASAFALLAGTVSGRGSESTDGSTPDEGSVPSSEEAIPFDPGVLPSEMQALRSAGMDDAEIMKTAAGLAADPDFHALAKDPEVVNAVKTLDRKTLAANPEFVNAVNDSAVKDIDPKVNDQE